MYLSLRAFAFTLSHAAQFRWTKDLVTIKTDEGRPTSFFFCFQFVTDNGGGSVLTLLPQKLIGLASFHLHKDIDVHWTSKLS